MTKKTKTASRRPPRFSRRKPRPRRVPPLHNEAGLVLGKLADAARKVHATEPARQTAPPMARIIYRVLDVNQDEAATFDNDADAERYADAHTGHHVVPSRRVVIVRQIGAGPDADALFDFITNELDAENLHARVAVEWLPVSDAEAAAEPAPSDATAESDGTGQCDRCGSLSPWRCGCYLTEAETDEINKINTAVHLEGWGIFNGNEIQRDDEAGVFKSDDAAIAHVRRKAKAGSKLHKRALALITPAKALRG